MPGEDHIQYGHEEQGDQDLGTRTADRGHRHGLQHVPAPDFAACESSIDGPEVTPPIATARGNFFKHKTLVYRIIRKCPSGIEKNS